MNIGQLLVVEEGGQIVVFSPWFLKGADNAIFTYEEIQMIGSPTFLVEVFHRKQEETGNGSAATGEGSGWLTAGSFMHRRYNNLKELVRFRFTLTSSNSGEAFESMLYRMLQATWFDKASS